MSDQYHPASSRNIRLFYCFRYYCKNRYSSYYVVFELLCAEIRYEALTQ